MLHRRPPKTTIQFDNDVCVQFIEHHRDFSRTEARACWYSTNERLSMKKQAEQEAREGGRVAAVAATPSDATAEEREQWRAASDGARCNHHHRALATMTSKAQQRRRRAAKHLVFEEQSFQEAAGVSFPETLSRTYMRMTKFSRIQAMLVGMLDQRAVYSHALSAIAMRIDDQKVRHAGITRSAENNEFRAGTDHGGGVVGSTTSDSRHRRRRRHSKKASSTTKKSKQHDDYGRRTMHHPVPENIMWLSGGRQNYDFGTDDLRLVLSMCDDDDNTIHGDLERGEGDEITSTARSTSSSTTKRGRKKKMKKDAKSNNEDRVAEITTTSAAATTEVQDNNREQQHRHSSRIFKKSTTLPMAMRISSLKKKSSSTPSSSSMLRMSLNNLILQRYRTRTKSSRK